MTRSTNEVDATSPETSPAALKDANASKPAKRAAKKATAAPQEPRVAPGKRKAKDKATHAKKAPNGAKGAKPTKSAKPTDGARQDSKTAKVLDLLKRPAGATLTELMRVTGWQAHSVRGFISGTLGKKMDLPVGSAKNDAGERVYRIEK